MASEIAPNPHCRIATIRVPKACLNMIRESPEEIGGWWTEQINSILGPRYLQAYNPITDEVLFTIAQKSPRRAFVVGWLPHD